ncbi:MAG TPA: M48 family metalloprotease [Candidatus Acidoferrales bacterium]|nr:M48 family metalloprotease [Candidatus Acidoferrales bacterium]
MTNLPRGFAVLFFVMFIGLLEARAQNGCPGLPPIRDTNKGDIFTEQQEMQLGDIIAQQLEPNLKLVQDDQLNSYLNEIAQRLLAQMPPTQMKFHIVLVDLPVANAFTFPGGRIYITRKLVAFAQSEDEIAGVLGHELGHALTHQPAADYSVVLREVLGVKQVGDRADIFQKYNQLMDNVAKKRLHFNLEQRQQEDLVADSYGLYATTRAGYSPRSMVTFWNRMARTNGKTGNWLSDLFGTTTPNEQRLRAMRKYVALLPPSCIAAKSPSNPAQFRAWQAAVIAYTESAGNQTLPGLIWKRQLSPPLESEVANVKFSPDGEYLLAQDDYSVYVLSHRPLKPLFRIPVDDVETASFTPDSKSVLIWSHSLHIEKWRVALQKRTDVNEVVTLKPCVQTDVSPDGALAVCIQEDASSYAEPQFDLSLVDVIPGATIIIDRHFYDVSMSDFFDLIRFVASRGRWPLFHMGFSPDGRYFAISRLHTALAWNLNTRAPVKLAGQVRNLMSGGFVFDGSDRIVGIDAYNAKQSGSAQFPSGPAGPPFPLFYGQSLDAPSNGPGILVRPAGKAAVALIDLKTGSVPLTSQISAFDVSGSAYARPRPDGEIGLFDLSTRKEIASTALPGHWIGPPRTAAVSSDLKWFAASGRTRGAVWDLSNGARVLHVRGFSGCAFSPQDNLYALFNSYLKEKRGIGALSPATGVIEQGAPLDDSVRIDQLGEYVLNFNRPKGKWNGPFDMQVYDVFKGTALWTHHFNSLLDVYASPSNDEMVLVMPLNSDEAREREKQDTSLRADEKTISSKPMARLIEIVDPSNGQITAEFPVDTGNGSFAIRQALPAGKWVAIADNDNRVLIYSLNGKLSGRLFGERPAVSNGIAALETQTGTLDVYDLATLSKRIEFAFGTPLAYYQFVDNGSGLFAITEDQVAYLLDLSPSKPN